MLLHTPQFLLLFAGICGLYWLLPRPAWRKSLLLLASYALYAAFDVRFALVLAGISAAAFFIGRALPEHPHPRRLVLLSILINLGALVYFKYTGFFLENLESLLRAAGIPPPSSLRIFLPVGISFYTFQAIAYIVEISRRKLTPAKDAADFGLYLAFFPKLIAGPFVRPADFLKQMADPPGSLSSSAFLSAFRLLLTGLFKKVVIADSLAALADTAFCAAASPEAAGFPAPLFIGGFYLYAAQIYSDFSGYTDLARGFAGFLGISLPENFRNPYFAVSPADFWNRWHITLTQWFREYLFFPLSRHGMAATGRRFPRMIQTGATLITMTLVGLWHGAAWTFILWGVWHGLLIVIDRLLGFVPRRGWEKILAALVTFHLVGIGWILFRAESVTESVRYLSGMISFQQPHWAVHFLLPAFTALLLLLALDAAGRWSQRFPRLAAALRPAALAAAAVAVAGIWILQGVSSGAPLPFIYGSF
ncbi:MAG: MBOAT family protein [Anaerolineales bacterium]|nr:MBOAT family protein [Anaerolineales bacterium]